MKLLVTGGTGFVMSVLGRHWLDADPDGTLDRARRRAAGCRGGALLRSRGRAARRSSSPT